jgi:antirestriction protein ArdC
VFHIRQCEGLRAKHTQPHPNTAAADLAADAIIRDYTSREAVRLHHSEGDRAFYRPSDDSITVPMMAQFSSTAEYYSTIFHELTHSTGNAKRLNRIDRTAFFGSEAYSKEELVAEIGAAALVNTAGLETASSVRNNAAYIQNWLTVLRNDKRFIVSAAGKAEKAVRLILGT